MPLDHSLELPLNNTILKLSMHLDSQIIFEACFCSISTALEEAVNAIIGIIYVFAKKVSDWGLLYRQYCKKSMKDSKMVDQTGMKVWPEGYFMNIFYPI